MGVLLGRIRALKTILVERARYGLPEVEGPIEREVLLILDGVGGFQFAPVMVRRVLRGQRAGIGTIVHRWQFGIPGEIWSDLMWLRRNRVAGARLARRLLALRRRHPSAPIHVLGFSGGTGVAVFACESLKGRRIINTLILAAPALSPEYNLGPALTAVERCYALVSPKDRVILGLGTRLFGTMDRRFGPGAGLPGFRLPAALSEQEAEAYNRLRLIRWQRGLIADGHRGGHTGAMAEAFLRRHLLPLVRGRPLLPTEGAAPA